MGCEYENWTIGYVQSNIYIKGLITKMSNKEI